MQYITMEALTNKIIKIYPPELIPGHYIRFFKRAWRGRSILQLVSISSLIQIHREEAGHQVKDIFGDAGVQEWLQWSPHGDRLCSLQGKWTSTRPLKEPNCPDQALAFTNAQALGLRVGQVGCCTHWCTWELGLGNSPAGIQGVPWLVVPVWNLGLE